MKRLDFEVVAQAMNDSKPRGEMSHIALLQWELDCESLALAFAKQTHCFERDRFLRNCGHTAPPPRS
jgi:hypothetical protein